MLPPTIPLSSRLPSVVLFPNVFLPLHIFEPRYRDDGRRMRSPSDRIVGTGAAAARTGRTGYEGRPPVYRDGVRRASSRTRSGWGTAAMNIVLRGPGEVSAILERGRQAEPYRLGRVDGAGRGGASCGRRRPGRDAALQRRRLEALLVSAAEGAEAQLPPALAGRGARQRAGAVPGLRPAGKPGAARAGRTAGAEPRPRRAARNEGDGRGEPPSAVWRRALSGSDVQRGAQSGFDQRPLHPPGDDLDDLFAVEAAVLDEDLAALLAGYERADDDRRSARSSRTFRG